MVLNAFTFFWKKQKILHQRYRVEGIGQLKKYSRENFNLLYFIKHI